MCEKLKMKSVTVFQLICCAEGEKVLCSLFRSQLETCMYKHDYVTMPLIQVKCDVETNTHCTLRMDLSVM